MKTNNVSGSLSQVVRDVLSVPKKVETDLKSLYQQFQSEVIKPVKSNSVSYARSLYRDGKWIDASKVFEAIGDSNRAMYCLHRALEAKEGVKSENYKKIAELYSSVGRTKRAKSYVDSSNYQLVRENKRSAKGFLAEEGIDVPVEKFVGVVGDMIRDNRVTFENNLKRPEFKQELLAEVGPRPAQDGPSSVVVAKKEEADVRENDHAGANIKFLKVRGSWARPREVAEQKVADKAKKVVKTAGASLSYNLNPAIKNSLLINDPGCIPPISFLANKDKKWNNLSFVKEQLYEANTQVSGSGKEMYKETYFRDKCFDYFKNIYENNSKLWTLLGSPKNFSDLAMVLYTPNFDPFEMERQLKLLSYESPSELGKNG